ncbi:precorrin-3B synthase [Pseudomonas sp. R5(2019)]|uniref:precorrin-3B synthase n=1 Tax=Pseudomonas sp. R5(2019) TaxID=2697566 RepID=UPI001411CE0B|nr:precorrin-3B synthase [Pseudomonas sp. R5(2019)]NBA95119.1 precorrin-3B synthase [Pseudomonas sp. R5(2019)]
MNEPVSARATPELPRPSACPGLLRIVQALDGGICRVKLAGGCLTATQALAIANAAERHASGVIEATNRANLQIRGVGNQHPDLIDLLLAAGLGPSHAGGDDVRNLMLSPSAGLDPQMLLDTRPLAGQILQSLERTERFHQLSAKFALQLDGGEGLAMLDHHHDLWLSTLRLDGEIWLAFGLGGCPGEDSPVGAVPVGQGHALVLAVLERFLDLATAEQSRMRQLLSVVSLDAFMAGLELEVRRDSAVVQWRRPVHAGSGHLGTYPQATGEAVSIGAAPELGRFDARQLRGLADLSQRYGDGTLRLTPWQSLLLPNVPATQAAELIKALQALGLLVDARAPLARLLACTGSAGCAKGLADTKADARQLANLLNNSDAVASVHLSGCRRSCACAHTAPATLLAVAPGRYDLYLRDARHPGFGALRASNLTLKEAGLTLDACSRSNLDD